MRYRLMATYRGVPYEAGIGPTDSDVVLFAACPPPEDLGFEPATGHWRKQLRIQDVQALWESRPMGMFRGDRCIVLDDLGDRLHIAYLGHDAYQAEQLGYWQVDRGVFELITPRDEVKEIVEERIDYPHQPAGAGAGAEIGSAALPSAGAGIGSDTAIGSAAGASGDARAGAAVNPPPADLAAPVPDGRADDTITRDLAMIPPTREAPLPLEAAARRAAAARSLNTAQRPSRQSPPSSPDPARPASLPPAQPASPPPAQPPSQSQRRNMRPAQPPGNLAQPPNHHAQPPNLQPAQPPSQEPEQPSPRRRRSAQRRLATQRIFSELAGLAAIPPSAYAVGEEVDGAMCLIQTPDGFEVFNAAAGARHEVRLFDDEESACFYLFGVLAAEAVRTGRLAPQD